MKSGTLHPSPICCHQLAPATLFGIREIAEPGKSAVLLRTLRQSPRLATKFQASTHQALTDSRLHKKITQFLDAGFFTHVFDLKEWDRSSLESH